MKPTEPKLAERMRLGLLFDQAEKDAPSVVAEDRRQEAEFRGRLAAMGGTIEAREQLLREYQERRQAEHQARMKAHLARRRKHPAA